MNIDKKLWWLAAGAYTFFVAYGNLVPLEFAEQSFSQAWSRFLATPFLKLQIYSRADWIANGVLFVPIGYLWMAVALPRTVMQKLLLAVTVIAAVSFGAVFLEFAQIFFPPRTVSRNDIYSECIGGALGVVLWLSCGRLFAQLCSQLTSRPRSAVRAALILYVIVYVLVSLFPFDLLLSIQELSHRLANRPPVFIAVDSGGWFYQLIGLLIEAAAFVPVGALLCSSVNKRGAAGVAFMVITAALVACIIEGAQLLTYTGSVEGVSLLTRVVGGVVGFQMYDALLRGTPERIIASSRRLAPILLVPYLVVLGIGNHWSFQLVADFPETLDKLSQLSFVPFYYHYYTPEVTALQKLLYQTVMYLPAGVFYVSFSLSNPETLKWWKAAVIGLVLSLVMFTGRLFTDVAAPDPTNVLVAVCAATIGYIVAKRLVGLSLGWISHTDLTHQLSEENSDHTSNRRIGTLFSIVLLGVVLVLAFSLKWPPVVSIAVIFTYCMILIKLPGCWIFILPALMPVLDFEKFTGWRVVDLFDLLMLATFAMCLLDRRAVPAQLIRSVPGLALLWFAGAYCVFAAVHGALLLYGIGGLSLLGFDSEWGPIRLLKGVLLPLLLFHFFVIESSQKRIRALRYLVTGLITGATILAASVVWERYVFTGLLDFQLLYRAAGSMSAMHTGGSSLDIFLVTIFPFVFYLFFFSNWIVRTLAVFVLLLVSYAIIVTYTRTTHVAALTTLVVLLSGFAITFNLRRIWWVAGVVTFLVFGYGAVIIFDGTPVVQRWSDSAAAAQSRIQHWSYVLSSSRQGLSTFVFGNGLGSYTGMRLTSEAGTNRPGLARILPEQDGNHFLHLTSGTPTYIDQQVKTRILTDYEFVVSVRAFEPARFSVSLCEKNLMNSTLCVTRKLMIEGSGHWHDVKVELPTGLIGERRGALGLRPPVVLSIFSPGGSAVIDIDNVRLRSHRGSDAVENGNFEKGRLGWFFTHDDHPAWHVHNMWVYVYFESGIIGLMICLAIGVYVLVILASAIGRNEHVAVFCSAALAAIVVSSLTDSVLDSPRSIMLVMWVLMLSLTVTTQLQPTITSSRKAAHRSVRNHADLTDKQLPS